MKTISIEQAGSSEKASALNLEGAKFEHWPGHWLS
jgi:hypothetical protein